jgi:hypothetical protein
MPLAVLLSTFAYDLTSFGPFAHVQSVFHAIVFPDVLTSVLFCEPTPWSTDERVSRQDEGIAATPHLRPRGSGRAHSCPQPCRSSCLHTCQRCSAGNEINERTGDGLRGRAGREHKERAEREHDEVDDGEGAGRSPPCAPRRSYTRKNAHAPT